MKKWHRPLHRRVLDFERCEVKILPTLVFVLNGMKEVGRIQRADEIETIRSVSGYFHHAVCLRAWLLVATDHVEVHHRAGRGKRTQRMLRHVVGAQQSTLL